MKSGTQRLFVTCSDPRCEHVAGAYGVRNPGGALLLHCQAASLVAEGFEPRVAERAVRVIFAGEVQTLMRAALASGSPIKHIDLRFHSHCAAAKALGLDLAGQLRVAQELASFVQGLSLGVEVIVVHDDHCERGEVREVRELSRAGGLEMAA